MFRRVTVATMTLLGVLAFCTGAVPKSLDPITNETLNAYTANEIEYGAPSVPVSSRILLREALELAHNGRKEAAIQKLELAASLTGGYAAPLFALARIEFLSASPDFLFHLVEGVRRTVMSYPAQAVLAANVAAFLLLTLFGGLFATLVALLFRYWPFVNHKIVEACARHSPVPARWIVGLVCVALLFMRLGLAIYIALLVVTLWAFMSRREKGIILAFVMLLGAASFFSRHSNSLAPAIDPRSITNRLAAVNQRGVSEDCIARIRAIPGDRYRAQRDFALGTMMYRFGLYDEARSHLLESVSVRPRSSSSFLNLGNVYFMQGDYDKALAGYQSAIELDPASAVANYNIGQTYIKKMLFAQSGEWLEKATILGIDAYRSAHPALALRNPSVYEVGFTSGELWSIAAAEGAARHNVLMSEVLRPLLLFPFEWLWTLLAASVMAAMIIAWKLPEAWHIERCDNCGGATCAACQNTQTGIRLCSDCAGVISGLRSGKVQEALLRTRRQKLAARRQRSRPRKTLLFPGVSYAYHGKTLSGMALSLAGAGAIALLAWRGAYFKDPRSMNPAWPLWNMIPPLAALAAAYLLSFRARAPQEQNRYHVLPAEMRTQDQGPVVDKEKAGEPNDPWKNYDAGAAAETPEKASFDSGAIPVKKPPREEALASTIEKGSKWH
jgi:tetratricopeptide (TPR) repeat protein